MTFKKIITLLLVITLISSGFLFISVPDTVKGNERLSDSPWPCFGGNAKHTGRSPYNTEHVIGEPKWSMEFEGIVFTVSPCVIGEDDILYLTNGNDTLFAINSNGTVKWEKEIRDLNYNICPAIGSDGIIYLGTIDGFYAVNPDGTVKWKFNQGEYSSSPVIGEDGTIYAGTYDGHLYAFNPNGTEKWNIRPGESFMSTPAVGKNGMIYVGISDNHLYAINPDGTVKWKYETKKSISSAPAISEDGTIYVGSVDDNLYAINPDGSLNWKFDTENTIWTSPAIGEDGTIYLCSRNDYLYALNPDGTVKWRIELGPTENNSPIIGSEGTIYVTDGDYLFAINPDGTEKWNDTITSNSPCCIDSDGTLYALGFEELYAYGRGFNLETDKEGKGLVHPYEGNNTYAIDKEIDVRAYADENWTFSHWTGDYPEGKKDERKITVTMDENKTLTAHFEKEEEDKGIPGFTVFPFVVAVGISLIYRRKGIKIDPEYSE